MDENQRIAMLRSETIKSEIETGRYRRKTVGKDNYTVYQCNIFVDDMASKYWGVSLPRATEDRRHSDLTEDSKLAYGQGSVVDGVYRSKMVSPYGGWDKRPLRVRGLQEYLFGKSMLPTSGVRQVLREEGAEIATNGGLVVWLHGTAHSSIMSPTEGFGWQRRPKIYRQEPFSDLNTTVGVSDRHGVFYHIDPQQYDKFKQEEKNFTTKSFQYLGKGRLEWLKKQDDERESERKQHEKSRGR